MQLFRCPWEILEWNQLNTNQHNIETMNVLRLPNATSQNQTQYWRWWLDDVELEKKMMRVAVLVHHKKKHICYCTNSLNSILLRPAYTICHLFPYIRDKYNILALFI